MATGISANRLELLQIADAVAREKSIDKEIVIAAIEEAIQKAARSRYGAEHDIRVSIDPKTGELAIKRCLTVVDQVENDDTEIGLADAKKRDAKAGVGMVFEEILPHFEFG
jgi:N utilization substance protein A